MFKKIAITFLSLASHWGIAQDYWTHRDLFQQKNFIENTGQFNNKKLPNREVILFTANIDGVEYCFTKSGYTIIKREKVKRTEREIEVAQKSMGFSESEENEESELQYEIGEQFHELKFTDASSELIIIPENKVSNYYTYSIPQKNGPNKSFQASAFTSLTYKNIYPFTDIIFEFPKDSTGIKYSIYLHPGADIEKVKFCFPKNNTIQLKNNNLEIDSPFGKIIDHQPTSFTKDHIPVKSKFKITGNKIGFEIEKIITNKTIIIDPWTVTPVLPSTSNAFEIDYDNVGNAYIYGGVFLGQYGLLKYNPAGTLLWSFIPITTGGSFSGDFVVDKNCGRCYLVEGFNGTFGSNVFKLNASGIPIAQFVGNPLFSEMWRVAFSKCINKLVIAGGSINSSNYQTCTMDTNLAAMSPVQYIPTTNCCHDISLLALDKYGNCYQGTNKKSSGPDGLFENQLIKLPLPSMLPVTYNVNTNYSFIETASFLYYGGFVGSFPSVNNSNGYNGLTTSNAFVYTYDGYVLKKWDGPTGNLLTYKRISYPAGSDSSKTYWGGISADDCENLFLADNNIVRQYNASLTLVNSYTMPGTITDINFNPTGKLYVCGLGFGSYLNPTGLTTCTTIPLSATASITNATCNTLGSATLTVIGGSPPYTITWNTTPIQYGPNLVNVLPGTYVATIQDALCFPNTITYTVVIGSSGYVNNTSSVINATCLSSGSATINSSGGTLPYTYNWSNGQTTPTATGLAAGTFTVIITDAVGCADTQTVIITQPPMPIANAISFATTCGLSNGSAIGSATGGTGPYTYLWTPNGATTATTNNLSEGNYTFIVTDNLGCSDSAQINIQESYGATTTISVSDTIGCSPFCIDFNSASSSSIINYEWSFGDGATLNSANPSHCYLSPGNYSVSLIATDSLGCIDTIINNSTITVLQSPTAAFIINPSSPVDINASVHFINQSSNATNWLWNFGDFNNTISTLQNPDFTFSQTGNYITELIVSNGPCYDTAYMTILVELGFTFYAPNTFTPNGNGLNDTFKPKGIMWNYKTYQLLIFDRWGKEIFKSTDPEMGWDGKVKGGDKIAQIDTYVWKVIVSDNKNNEHNFIGHVNLVK